MATGFRIFPHGAAGGLSDVPTTQLYYYNNIHSDFRAYLYGVGRIRMDRLLDKTTLRNVTSSRKEQNTITRYNALIVFPTFIRILEIASPFLNGYYDCF